MIRSLILALILSACAITERYDATGALTERRIGFMPLVVAPTAEAPAVRVRGAGALYGGGAAVAGYYDLTVIKPPKDCSAFIFVDDADEARRWAGLAADINGLCAP